MEFWNRKLFRHPITQNSAVQRDDQQRQMDNTKKNSVGIEEIHHVIQTNDNANDGSNSISRDVDFVQIQSQYR